MRRRKRKKKTKCECMNPAVRVAHEHGYITEAQARRADKLCEGVDVVATPGQLVEAGLLSNAEAEQLSAQCREENTGAFLAVRFKEAKQAMQRTRSSARELGEKTGSVRLADVLAAKKAQQGSR